MIVMDELGWLQQWYLSQCNDEWEHAFGVDIGTLDNPGWTLDVDLDETDLAKRVFQPVTVQRSTNDWVVCKVKDGKFTASCGPQNLSETIGIFRAWAETIS